MTNFEWLGIPFGFRFAHRLSNWKCSTILCQKLSLNTSRNCQFEQIQQLPRDRQLNRWSSVFQLLDNIWSIIFCSYSLFQLDLSDASDLLLHTRFTQEKSSKSDLKLVNYFLNSNWTIDDHDLDAFAVRKNIKFLYYLCCWIEIRTARNFHRFVITTKFNLQSNRNMKMRRGNSTHKTMTFFPLFSFIKFITS